VTSLAEKGGATCCREGLIADAVWPSTAQRSRTQSTTALGHFPMLLQYGHGLCFVVASCASKLDKVAVQNAATALERKSEQDF